MCFRQLKSILDKYNIHVASSVMSKPAELKELTRHVAGLISWGDASYYDAIRWAVYARVAWASSLAALCDYSKGVQRRLSRLQLRLILWHLNVCKLSPQRSIRNS